jgi:threonine/homoserine/homoserine lactone efflux protein
MDTAYVQFLAGALIISLSGVMAPGPLTAVTVGKGADAPSAGALVAVGHGIVEFPLMTAIFLGFGFLFNMPFVRPAIGIAGGIYLFFLAAGTFKGARKQAYPEEGRNSHSPLVSGIMLSAGNPYFLLWWASVGATLVMQSAAYGVAGLIAFMVPHWVCDLAWSWFLSALSYKGGNFFGKSFQKIIAIASSVVMVFFGGRFIYDAISGL